ncbi:hypothetical protein CERSUDRAFT_72523 [Gelatoporia subvermispora B]|uniref:F-box domain-containing protein n=1 Tax=Ceriporiopsis subvermispora (strain B) TaxID=914234 RepID=M2RLM0_CERS8|nr:hypothetical protein CERSUDRAFT_72523 [Gelatoporia subvermispora B]
MSALPCLNDDCARAVFDQLDKPSLVTVTRSSKAAFNLAILYLVRDVTLDRDSEQIRGFCQCVVTRNFAEKIQHLHVHRCAVPGDGWVDVLQRAKNLNSLILDVGVEDLAIHTDSISTELVTNPPSEVRESFKLGGKALLLLLSANAGQLRSVSFDRSIYNCLEWTNLKQQLQFLNVESLTVPAIDRPLQVFSLIFPHVRYFYSNDFKIPDVSDNDGSRTTWTSLISVEGLMDMIFWLTRHHPSIRRLRMSRKHDDWGIGTLFSKLCGLLTSLHITSLTVDCEIVEDVRVLMNGTMTGQWLVEPCFESGKFWSGLASAVPYARFLSICFKRHAVMLYQTMEALFTALSDEAIFSLGTHTDLRYISLSLDGEIAEWEKDHIQNSQDAFPTRDVLSAHWFSRIPSLELLKSISIFGIDIEVGGVSSLSMNARRSFLMARRIISSVSHRRRD